MAPPTTVDAAEAFVLGKAKEYRDGEDEDGILWADFASDFRGWTEQTFELVDSKHLTKLRDNLKNRGVFIKTGSAYKMAKTLTAVTQAKDDPPWTDDEAQYWASNHNVNSWRITHRLKQIEAGRPIDKLMLPSAMTVTTNALKQQDTGFYGTSNNQGHNQPPPLPPQTPIPENASWGHQIANLNKIYEDSSKYSAEGDNFDYKLRIFYDKCRMAFLPEEAYGIALPTMLKGTALEHYHQGLSGQSLPFLDLCARIKSHFEGPNYTTETLQKWTLTDMNSIKALHPEKTALQCLDELLNELRRLRHGLSSNLQSDDFFHAKLLMACRFLPDCQVACSAPPAALPDFVRSLKSCMTTYAATQCNSATFWTLGSYGDDDDPESFFGTDRRYRNNRIDDRSRGSRFGGRSGGNSRFSKKTCYICKKPNCWSTNHSEEEQKKMKEDFRKNNAGRFKGRTDQFDERYRQYVALHEGFDDKTLEDQFLAAAFGDSDVEDEFNQHFAAEDFEPRTFFCSSGEISAPEARDLTAALCNQAYGHVLSATASEPEAGAQVFQQSHSPRYDSDVFWGILIDSGGGRHSTVGRNQYLAYSKFAGNAEPLPTAQSSARVKFGIGAAGAVGSVQVRSPIGLILFHIFDTDTPFILGLRDMDRLRVKFDNLDNVLNTPRGDVAVMRRGDHAFLIWDEYLSVFIQYGTKEQIQLPSTPSPQDCYLSDVELRRLHRRFGHPSVQRLHRVLERAGHDVDSRALEHLTKYCEHCQKHGTSPGRFKFTLKDDAEFNYCIFVDVVTLAPDGPVLHIVDEATAYQAGRWLKDFSAKTAWETIRECWIDTYLGPPDLISHDAGTNFESREFKQYAQTVNTTTKCVPVEAHHSIRAVERYHRPLRRAYDIIKAESPNLDKTAALQMAFKALNDTAGPDGIVPTLLVFGAYPRMSEFNAPPATISQRSTALAKAMTEVRKLRAARKVTEALRMRNGPSTTAIHDLPLNSQVLVWREKAKWQGPYRLLSLQGETCVVELSSGPTMFRSTSVKPYLTNANAAGDDSPSEPPAEAGGGLHPADAEAGAEDTIVVELPPPGALPNPPIIPAKRPRGRPRIHPLPVTNLYDFEAYIGTDFTASRQAEIAGLIAGGVLELVAPEDVPEGTRIFGSRFVDTLKGEGTDKAFEKSRLVIQAYNDAGKLEVLTQSPTIQRVSQRLILILAAIFPELLVLLRDISQAYTQSETLLQRLFYALPPKDVAQWRGWVLRVVRPLYGVPEAGNHWYGTYHKHHIEKLHMSESSYDSCLLFVNDTQFAVVGLQTDDTLILADPQFAAAEEIELQAAGFRAKPRDQLTVDSPIKFNGCTISRRNDEVHISQARYNKNLQLVSNQPADLTSSRGTVRRNVSPTDQYVAQRARGAYLATLSQPEAAFDLSRAAQVTKDKIGTDEISFLNGRIQWQKENADRGLKYVKLDEKSLRMIIFTDSSFANNTDLSSQIGYVMVLADASDKANILHWSSTKCKRVTRSVLAAELYAMSAGFDMASCLKSTIEAVLKLKLPMEICTDSKSIYDCLVKLGTTQEKRLMVDLMCLRQSYERREITDIQWIDGNSNPADAMTKSKPNAALKELIDTNKLNIKVTQWVERKEVAARE